MTLNRRHVSFSQKVAVDRSIADEAHDGLQIERTLYAELRTTRPQFAGRHYVLYTVALVARGTFRVIFGRTAKKSSNNHFLFRYKNNFLNNRRQTSRRATSFYVLIKSIRCIHRPGNLLSQINSKINLDFNLPLHFFC
jgi:hypothetical protein